LAGLTHRQYLDQVRRVSTFIFREANMSHVQFIAYAPYFATIACAGIGICLLMTDRTTPAYFFFGLVGLATVIRPIVSSVGLAKIASALFVAKPH
jgi:hypothetical protein